MLTAIILRLIDEDEYPGTISQRLERLKEGFFMTRPIIQKIPEDHDVLLLH
jgi:hypothetical protein